MDFCGGGKKLLVGGVAETDQPTKKQKKSSMGGLSKSYYCNCMMLI